MKKYRIIQHPNGKYRVQYKDGFFDEWRNEYTYNEDYPSYNILKYEDWRNSEDRKDQEEACFSSLELAKNKINKSIYRDNQNRERQRQRKLQKKFKVIEVRKV